MFNAVKHSSSQEGTGYITTQSGNVEEHNNYLLAK